MSAQGSRLREIQADPAPQADSQQPNVGMQLLLLALKTLSQRTVVAIAALRGMVLAGAVFWLSMVVVESPSVLKLVGLGIFAAFVLLAEMMVSKKR